MDTPQSKGGRARAENLAPAQRSEIAKKAAASRWDTSIPTATHIGELHIGDLILSCAVLPDGTRVISQGGVTTAFGPVTGGWQQRQKGADDDSGDLPSFLVAKSLKPFISDDLRTLVSVPRKYRDPRGGPIRVGLEATLLPKVCEVWLRARDATALTKIQVPVAERADTLMRGLAHTGIVALVDEATGYQEVRPRDELQKILAAYISPTLLPWTERFPIDFFKEMFRVYGWDWPYTEGNYPGPQGPRYAGKLIKKIIFENLPPGVLEQLDKLNPPDAKWQRKSRMSQLLTSEIGHPHVEKLVAVNTMLFRVSDDKDDFKRNYMKAFPKKGDQYELLPPMK